MRPSLLLVLASCSVDAEQALPDGELPAAASMTLEGPDRLFLGQNNTFEVTGNLGQQEMVYLIMSRTGVGAGPCPQAIGGQCLSLLAPRIIGQAFYEDGLASIDITLPPATVSGADLHFQAAVLRGRGGLYSVLSNTVSEVSEDYILGCTNAAGDNYNPAATVDDGSCAIPGCTNPISPGYDPEATYDDGSCPPPLYAIWDPARSGPGVTYTNGNRAAAAPGNSTNVVASIGKSSGKWYWEVTWTGLASGHLMVGAASASAPLNNWNMGATGALFYSFANPPYSTLSYTGTNRGYGHTNVVGFALDMDARTLTHYVNGVQGATVSGLPATEIYPMIGYAHGNTVSINAGQDPFVYTPPAGFTAGLY
jgi:hypothetical protein